MTELERLWDDLPTPAPPTAAILREARQTTRVRRQAAWRRPVIATGVAAAVVAAFAGGVVISRGGGSSAPPSATGPAISGLDASPVSFVAPLKAASSCDALLASYVARGLKEVTAWGWGYGVVAQHGELRATSLNGVWSGQISDASPVKGLQTTRAKTSATGTNVQESSVDEPDTVKTDGHLLTQLVGNDLKVYDVSATKPQLLSTMRLSGFDSPELLLSGSTLVVLGGDSATAARGIGSRVETLSLTDPSAPKPVTTVTYGGTIADARQTGTVVRLVLDTGLPDLHFLMPNRKHHLTVKAAAAHNEALVRHSTLADWLPSYTTGGSTQPLLDCGSVALPPVQVGFGTTSVVGFDASTPGTVSAIGVAGTTDISYQSSDQLYLAAPPSGCEVCLGVRALPGGPTYLFAFDLSGTSATQVASGLVHGTIADRWSMDAAGGVLRVAVSGWRRHLTNSVVTFRQDGDQLVRDGRLDLGQGDQLQAVRWFDDLAIVTTYRQTDPLYVIDLRDPAHPSIVSRLEASGYSDYLQPLGPGRIVGVGYGPGPDHRWGAQLGLFDVYDVADVRLRDSWHLAGADPQAASDPRAFTWLPVRRIVLTVIQKGRTTSLLVAHLTGGKMHTYELPVGSARAADQVRAIDLPDRRVLLVTPDGVSNLVL